MSDFDKLNCAQVRDALFDYLSGGLGIPAIRMIEEHIAHCEQCSAELEATREALRVLRANDPAAGAPRALSERSRRRVMWYWTHPAFAWCIRYHHWISLTAALVVLFFVCRWLYFYTVGREPVPKGIEVEILKDNPDTLFNKPPFP